MKFRKIPLRLAGLVFLLCCAAQVLAQNEPYRIHYALNQAGLGNGGDSVTSTANWAFVTKQPTCEAYVYEQNQATMLWDFKEIVLGSPTQCENTEFGTSSSIAGNVAVVGGPGHSGSRGSWFIFEYDPPTDDWDRVGNIKTGNINQAGQRLGEVISITKEPGQPNYLIAIGAPNYDTNNDASYEGRVEIWTFTEGDNSGTHVTNIVGGPGDGLGYSVTTNWPFVMAGAVGSDQFGPGTGKVVIYDSTGAVIQTLGTPDALTLGTDVSLSDRLALAAGAGIVDPDNAFAWSNTGTVATPVWSLGSNRFTVGGTLDYQGDVSQSDGVASFGNVESGLPGDGQVFIYRDAINDAVPGDGILIDVAVEFPADDLTDVGDDIRLNRSSVLMANGTWDAGADPASNEGQAIVYQYPCGYGTKLEADVWKMVSIPCNLGAGADVADVFGANIDGPFEIYEIDEDNPATDLTSRNPYRQMLSTDLVNQNRSYWVKADTAQYFTIAQPAAPAPDPEWTDPLINIAGLGGTASRAWGRTIPAPDTPPGGGTAFARIMVANPFERAFYWGDLLFIDGAFKSLAQAEADGELMATGYVYDTGVVNAAGQNYRAITATPGFDNHIKPYEGFWMKVLQNHPGSEVLLIPRPR